MLARDLPKYTFVLNGGLTTVAQCANCLTRPVGHPLPAGEGSVSGIMLGRAAHHDSYLLAKVETALYGTPLISRDAVVEKMIAYARDQIATTQTHRHPTQLLNEKDPELLRRAMPYQSEYDDHQQPVLDAMTG
jgi:tRNA-dihydrouridine synthase A